MRLLYLFWTLLERNTMAIDIGTGHRAAAPRRGLKRRIAALIAPTKIMALAMSGNHSDMACSCWVTSPMILSVMSVGSFFSKKDIGSFLSLSDIAVRTFALSR